MSIDIESVKTELNGVETRLKQLFEEQRQEIQANGQVNEQLKNELNDLSEKQKDIGDRLFDLEQSGRGMDTHEGRKSLFQKFSEEAVESLKGGGGQFRSEVGSFDKALTTDESSTGVLSEPMRVPGIIRDPDTPLRVRDLLAQGRMSTSSLEYVREESVTNNAAIVPEGQLKPESDFTFSKQSTTTKVIAHWIHASKQALSDAPMLESYIRGRLLYGLGAVEDAQFLNGDGTGDNLEGINTVATAYDTSLDATDDTQADKLAHALFQVTESEYQPNGFVLHPRDWHTLALMKDGDGRYILGGPQVFAQRTLWGLPVVPTVQQAQGTFTVGAFNLASQVWDQWDASVTVSDQDRDNFVKNMITVLAEERLALAHYRPKALVTGTFV